MVKTNLPVILLRGAVLLPYCEFRLELNNDIDKHILKLSEDFHDKHILIVSPSNPLEEVIDIDSLPKIGTVAKINMKMELGNITRIMLEGVNRVKVEEYVNYGENDSVLNAVITSTTQFAMSPLDETALIRKLNRRVETYVSKVPNISNGILSQISNVNSISKISDIVANYLPIEFERKLEYLNTINPYKRVIMLFEDIKTEEEIVELDKKIDLKLKEALDNSQKEYVLREKIRLIKEELGDINLKENDVEILKDKISKLKCNSKVKDKLYSELKKYEMMNSNSPEVSVVRNYIDLMLSLPWNTLSKENKNLRLVKERLDNTHYGLDNVKERIIEFLAVKELSNDLKTPIICLVGPPGVGKTTLARSIAESIDRKFVKISVGGVNDEAEIIGHRRTYIGSSPGKIISAMKKCKVNNPVFLIDEIDKMTKDVKGDPASTLLEVLDPEQNKYFTDSYVEEEYDLSHVMFILTANYLYQIPEALRDRLEIIEINGYTEYEKLDIAKKHLITRLLKEHGLDDKNVSISDNALMMIIRNYTKEAGVRELERCISKIFRKIAKEIVVNDASIKKYKITEKNLIEYLGKKKFLYEELDKNDESGIANGLAYTEYGGVLLPIEVTYYKGKGALILTGSLGNVMKESAEIALSYIKSHYDEFGINYKLLTDSDIHIHVPEGAVPKDGPSAGITLTSALISAFTNKPIDKSIGMTGEITLRGTVLPIGGLKEKTMGAHRSGIKKILIPSKNECDLEEIPSEIKKDIKFVLVNNYEDVYKEIYKKEVK
ncbi:lon protease [Clostridium sp. CAG:1193]|jgi:ATP-dependent Lon protease|nr:lon protease [Clostridium sp. CAG:1193]